MKLSKSAALAILLLGALVMRVISSPTANMSYLALAVYALLGRPQAIQALFCSWLFSMINPGIAPEASLDSVGRYAVLACAAVSVSMRALSSLSSASMPISRTVLLTVLMGILIAVHGLIVSPMPDVSVLKALSWTVAASTLFSAWSGLDQQARDLLERQIFGGLLALMLLSFPLLVTSVGYLRNGTGFQGLLAHPQAFGPTMGLLAAWSGSQVLAVREPRWRWLAVFGGCLVLIVLSEARTAGLATVLGLALAGASGSVLSGRRVVDFLPGLRSARLHLALSIGVVLAIAGASALSDRLDQYLTKRGESESLLEAYEESRGGLVDGMWSNIVQSPLRGIGFGIGSDPAAMEVVRDPILGLPTGAAIEKGVLPLAVLEELGAFGFTLVALWVAVLLRRAARGSGMTAVSVAFAAFLMNMGESVLFSVGGMGLLLLILITWAATAPQSPRKVNYA